MANSSERTAMKPNFKRYANVLIDIGLKSSFQYGISAEIDSKLEKGSCVRVPLRGVLQTGIIVDFAAKTRFQKVLPIHSVVSDKPLMTPQLFQLAEWLSHYYHAPISKTLKLFFPKSVRKGMGHKKQQVVSRAKSIQELREICTKLRSKRPKQAQVLDVLLKTEKEIFLTELLEKAQVTRSVIQTLEKNNLISLDQTEVDRDPLKTAEFFPSKPKILNPDQKKALDAINQSIHAKKFNSFLLHGVTGSGKTEVYLQCIENTLRQGQRALMLVPEIALTTQTVEKLKSRFKDKIAILHHRLGDGERHDQWHQIREGRAKIVIGARSAIFAPIDEIGLVIVDEEHELSYKQTEEMPTYNARDVAVMRAKMSEATVVLGSATPSLESYYNVSQKKYKLLVMPNRASMQAMPAFHVVDMKRENEISKGFTLFSQPLLNGIEKRFKKGEQTIIFLNRRGYHTSLVCTECGAVDSCPHCDLALTFHRKKDILACHMCDYSKAPSRCCQQCKSPTTKFRGYGTENVEQQLRKIFPEIRTLRMDTDTTKHVGSYEKLYYSFKNHKADILIGTQMVAKGLHFPSVTLVGILNCDRQFNIPDFKCSETAFQLLTQVAGRAGRGEIKGEVIIQTYNPQNSIIKNAIDQDYDNFFTKELASRQFFNYPPNSHLIKIVFKGKDEKQTQAFTEKYYQVLKRKIGAAAQLISPQPCGYPKIKEYFRFQILLRGTRVYTMTQILAEVENELKRPSTVQYLVDVDPSSTFF